MCNNTTGRADNDLWKLSKEGFLLAWRQISGQIERRNIFGAVHAELLDIRQDLFRQFTSGYHNQGLA